MIRIHPIGLRLAAFPRRMARATALLALLALCNGGAALAQSPSAQPASARAFTVERNSSLRLTPAQKIVRDQVIRAVETDIDGYVARYLEYVTATRGQAGTRNLQEALQRGGLLIGADEAKDLFERYRASKETRMQYSAAVHEASTALVDEVWDRALACPPLPSRDGVLLLGGGVASGKTTSLRRSPVVCAALSRVEMVYDGTLSHLPYARALVDQALASKRRVRVVYVTTPIDVACRWAVRRALASGRVVPASVVAGSHWRSQQTVLALAKQFATTPDVRFDLIALDDRGDGRLLPIRALEARRYDTDRRFENLGDFTRYVERCIQAELRTLRGEGVSRATVQALAQAFQVEE